MPGAHPSCGLRGRNDRAGTGEARSTKRSAINCRMHLHPVRGCHAVGPHQAHRRRLAGGGQSGKQTTCNLGRPGISHEQDDLGGRIGGQTRQRVECRRSAHLIGEVASAGHEAGAHAHAEPR